MKSKTTAVLLAVFLCPGTWLYTYRKDGRKFWVWFIASTVGGVLLGLMLPSDPQPRDVSDAYTIAWLFGLGYWVWTLQAVARRPGAWYANYDRDAPHTYPKPPTTTHAPQTLQHDRNNPVFCVGCGAVVGGDWSFCNRCGHEVPTAPSPVPTPRVVLATNAAAEQFAEPARSSESSKPLPTSRPSGGVENRLEVGEPGRPFADRGLRTAQQLYLTGAVSAEELAQLTEITKAEELYSMGAINAEEYAQIRRKAREQGRVLGHRVR